MKKGEIKMELKSLRKLRKIVKFKERAMERELREIVEYNERMMDTGREDLVITFYEESEGISVHDPFYDATGRFEVKPLEEYKKEALQGMIESYKKNKKS